MAKNFHIFLLKMWLDFMQKAEGILWPFGSSKNKKTTHWNWNEFALGPGPGLITRVNPSSGPPFALIVWTTG
jgi:hypothetical protein